MFHRVLSFIGSKFEFKIPAHNELTTLEIECIDKMRATVDEYVQKLEKVKIKEGLKIAMHASQICNKYIQDSNGFEIFKTDKARAGTIYKLAANLLVVVSVLLEPYIPSFSAKIYSLLNLERNERTAQFLKEIHQANNSESYLTFIETGHPINESRPIFKEITDDQVKSWREKYGEKV